jgi:hypothetical protein
MAEKDGSEAVDPNASERNCANDLRFGVFTAVLSPHSRVAMQLDLCQSARLNIDLIRPAWLWKPVFRQGHNVMAGAEGKTEATFSIGRKSCDLAFLVCDHEDGVWKGGCWHLRSFSNWSRPGRTDHNNSLNSGAATGFGFCRRNSSIHSDYDEKKRAAAT